MSLKGFPFFMAIAIYCYEGAGMILALEASLAEEVRHKFKKFFTTAMIVVTSLYITFGACGYLSFGPDTKSIITLNLPKGLGLDFSMLVKSCLCLGIFFTYPVMLFPVNKILESYFLQDGGKTVWKGNVVRFVLVLTTGVVVQAIPNFANLMALVGASCCTLLAFILPGIFHMNVFKDSLTKRQRMMDWFLVFVGILGTVIGTWDALIRLSEHPTPENQVPSAGIATTIENITAAAASNISHIIAPSVATPSASVTVSSVNDSVVKGVLSTVKNVTASPGLFTSTLLNSSTEGLEKTASQVVQKILQKKVPT